MSSNSAKRCQGRCDSGLKMIIVAAHRIQNEKPNRIWPFNNSYFQVVNMASYQDCEVPFWEAWENGGLGDKSVPIPKSKILLFW